MIHQYRRTMRMILSTALGLMIAAPMMAASPQGQPPPGQPGGPSQAQQDQDVEVQTRGPVHEAFADLVTFDPTPGAEISREPPPPIEEVPPDQRPEGNQALWINGYWSWDDDRNDFLWVSGVWRVPPPDHSWTPGYWHRGASGWGWVQGFWLPNQGQAAAEVTYLAPPPENLEAGPSSPQPSEEHLWGPGCWTWMGDRYAWRPGSWIVANPDWVWTSACYRWTPAGHVFIEGHWDHLLRHRGVLFAPVVFRRRQAMYPEYHYSPSIGIDLGILSLHLFSRPQYNHYYFGDWYAPTYWDRGIYPTFAFHMSSYGYDPIYQHNRWEHRANEVQWEASIHADFHRYRDDEHARPQHTFAAQQAFVASRGPDRRDEIVMARPVRDLPAQRGSDLRLEAVPAEERRQITAINKEQFRATAERGKIESDVATRRPVVKDHVAAPEKVALPRAPVIAHVEAKARPPASPVRTQPPAGGREPKDEQPGATGKPTAPPTRKPDVKPGEREGNAGQPGRPVEKPAHEPTPTPTPAKPVAPPTGKPVTPPVNKPEPKPSERKPEPPDAPTPKKDPVTRPPVAPPSKPEPKVDPKPEPKPDQRTDPRPAPKTDPKPEQKPTPEGRKPEAPAVTPKPAAPHEPDQGKPQQKRLPPPQLPKKVEKAPGKGADDQDPKKPKQKPDGGGDPAGHGD